MVGTVGLIEAEDDVVLVVHRVVDVVHPGFVLLQVAGDHGYELFSRRWRPTGAGAAGTEVLGRSLLVVGSHSPVVPPAGAENDKTSNINPPSLPPTNLTLLKAAKSPQWKFSPGGIQRPFLTLLPCRLTTRQLSRRELLHSIIHQQPSDLTQQSDKVCIQ